MGRGQVVRRLILAQEIVGSNPTAPAMFLFNGASPMETKRNSTKNIIRIVLVTVLILMVPFLAMQLQVSLPDPGGSSGKVNWTLGDFIVMGSLLIGTGLSYELIARKLGNATQRAILAIVILVAFLLIWIELAVGLFGSPFAGN